MFPASRSARLACCAAALLTACAGPASGPSPASRSALAPTGAPAPAAPSAFGGVAAAEGDRGPLGDFCGWYNDDLPQSMDTISGFLGAFAVADGDYGDPRVEGLAQGAEQAAGEAADTLNDFLTGFPNDLSDSARRAVLALRDALAALASAVRDQQGPERVNAAVALFDDAYKALRPACAA
ncbi:thiopurine S-methyltransferase [Segniliparus rotundus]|uniref:thiopurine S-methyltransferase n=1 Tax=Segniliparus rotundus TaxID=286802 RepID=UPI0011D0473C|nr:thiopurine S-methyltransferase [Segniliparus rotundus]